MYIYIQNGLNTLQGSMCDHLQRVLSTLNTSGRLHLSTTGPPHADNSLLNVDKSYWSSASAQTTGRVLWPLPLNYFHLVSLLWHISLCVLCNNQWPLCVFPFPDILIRCQIEHSLTTIISVFKQLLFTMVPNALGVICLGKTVYAHSMHESYGDYKHYPK